MSSKRFFKFDLGDLITYYNDVINKQITVQIFDYDYEHYHVKEPRSGLKWIVKIDDLHAKGFKYLKFNKIWKEVNEDL